jgi:hypothetical protein
MNGIRTRPVPGWYWAAAALALLWEGFGCFVYLGQVMIEPEARSAGYAAMAQWQWAVFAVATWSGLLGAVGLLARRSWALLLLLLSLVAAAVQYGYELAIGGFSAASAAVAAAVIVAGFLLVAFANLSKRRGWLG